MTTHPHECTFCHRPVTRLTCRIHVFWHTRRRRDGQQQEHVTLNPQARFAGSLDGVPRLYRHSRCEGITIMPEEIVRSYLVDTTLYSSETFCTGCGDYVPHHECRWIETDQDLASYFKDLRKDPHSS